MKKSLLYMICFFSLLALPAKGGPADEDQDILDRADVQQLLFGASTSSSASSSSPRAERESKPYSHFHYLQLEIATEAKAVTGGIFYNRKVHPYFKFQGGLTYHEESEQSSRSLAAKVMFLLNWDRFFLQPFGGLETGMPLLTENHWLSSRAIVGCDLQLTQHLGLSARRLWKLPSDTLINSERHVEAVFEEPEFELAFYWRI